MNNLTLVKSRVHVLREALSGKSHNKAQKISVICSITKEGSSFRAPSQVKANYGNDTTLGPVCNAFEGISSHCAVQRECVARLFKYLNSKDGFLLCDNKM